MSTQYKEFPGKMFDLIKKIIGSGNGIVQTTDQEILTAHLALTVLLLDAAYADGECSGEEKEHLVTTLVTNLPTFLTSAIVT